MKLRRSFCLTLLMAACALRPASAGMEIIAHRGAMSLAPENTLASQRLAYELGAECVEVDVRLTSDLVPINLHDHDVKRTTNGSGNVAYMTLEQVRQLDAGSWFSPRYAGERVPTIAECLEVAKQYNRKIMLDIKGQFMAPQVVEVIRQSGIPLNQIAFFTWWEGMTEGYTSRLPGVQMLRPPTVVATGSSIRPENMTTADLLDLRRQKVTTLIFGSGYVSKFDIDRFHAAGFEVSCLYQPPNYAPHYQDLGLDSFWTDDADIAVASLERRTQQWHQWAEGAGLAPDQNNTWQDVDGDGMNNLFEYALGRNPLVSDAVGLAFDPATNTIGWTMDLRENWSQYLMLTPQSNSGTGAWTSLPAAHFTPLSPTRMDFRVPVAPGRKFFRMKIDFPP